MQQFCRVAAVALALTLALAGVALPGAQVAAAADPLPILVTIGDGGFSPPSLTIDVGGSVAWKNTSARARAVKSEVGIWDSGNIQPNEVYILTFKTAGTYFYSDPTNTSAATRASVVVGSGGPIFGNDPGAGPNAGGTLTPISSNVATAAPTDFGGIWGQPGTGQVINPGNSMPSPQPISVSAYSGYGSGSSGNVGTTYSGGSVTPGYGTYAGAYAPTYGYGSYGGYLPGYGAYGNSLYGSTYGSGLYGGYYPNGSLYGGYYPNGSLYGGYYPNGTGLYGATGTYPYGSTGVGGGYYPYGSTTLGGYNPYGSVSSGYYPYGTTASSVAGTYPYGSTGVGGYSPYGSLSSGYSPYSRPYGTGYVGGTYPYGSSSSGYYPYGSGYYPYGSSSSGYYPYGSGTYPYGSGTSGGYYPGYYPR